VIDTADSNFLEDIMEKYKYTITFPSIKAHDVAQRELHVIVNDVESVDMVDINCVAHELIFSENDVILIYLVDIDDAGNRSTEGAVLDFVVVNRIPPVAPDAPVIGNVIVVVEEPGN
jgi:hypothetical protein